MSFPAAGLYNHNLCRNASSFQLSVLPSLSIHLLSQNGRLSHHVSDLPPFLCPQFGWFIQTMAVTISPIELCGVHNRVMLCLPLPSEKINMIRLTNGVLKSIYYRRELLGRGNVRSWMGGLKYISTLAFCRLYEHDISNRFWFLLPAMTEVPYGVLGKGAVGRQDTV
jgi:hypothetical protein